MTSTRSRTIGCLSSSGQSSESHEFYRLLWSFAKHGMAELFEGDDDVGSEGCK
jgi:hypothetical protein